MLRQGVLGLRCEEPGVGASPGLAKTSWSVRPRYSYFHDSWARMMRWSLLLSWCVLALVMLCDALAKRSRPAAQAGKNRDPCVGVECEREADRSNT